MYVLYIQISVGVRVKRIGRGL